MGALLLHFGRSFGGSSKNTLAVVRVYRLPPSRVTSPRRSESIDRQHGGLNGEINCDYFNYTVMKICHHAEKYVITLVKIVYRFVFRYAMIFKILVLLFHLKQVCFFKFDDRRR